MTGDRVVIGVDFSGGTLRGAPWAARHIVPQARMTLAHALDLPRIPSFLRSVVDDIDVVRAHQAAIERLTEWRVAAGLGDAELTVREGRPDVVLRDVAAAFSAGLIVIGPHGNHQAPWKRLGSTAERLMRAADTSVLVVRGPMAGAPQRILVAVDDVEITDRVLAVAGAIATNSQGSLHAVHVLSNAAYSHMLSAEGAEQPDRAKAAADLREAMASETLRWLRMMWKGSGHRVALHAEVTHGSPAAEILRVARDNAIQLIMIGRYGIGRMVPAFLGSVLGSIVAGAECPVLVVAR